MTEKNINKATEVGIEYAAEQVFDLLATYYLDREREVAFQSFLYLFVALRESDIRLAFFLVDTMLRTIGEESFATLIGTVIGDDVERRSFFVEAFDKVKKNFDYVIIDCMPSLGMITINALSAADSVSIPVQAHYLPAKGMEQLLKKEVNRVMRGALPSFSLPKEQVKELRLPKASDNNDRAIEYLKDRGVDEELVRKCIYEGIIYEDSRFHSAIFVGFDEQGKPAHASYRSTNGSGLKGDLRGSNKAYSFRIEQKSGDKVRVFESAIDLLSYASICKLKGCEEDTAV